MWKLVNVVEEVDSPYNGKISVVKSLEGTRMLVGGLSQSGWLVKKVWKEALKKVKKLKPEVKSVLILGLGGGSVAQLVQDYWPQSAKTGLDIDKQMVALGRKYLRLSEVKRLKVVIADAGKWIKNHNNRYDLILVDMYKGANIPKSFITKNFARKVKELLSKDGIAAFNHLYSPVEKVDADRFGQNLREVFPASTSVAPEANIIFICFS